MTLLTTAPIAKKISSVHEYYTSKNYMSIVDAAHKTDIYGLRTTSVHNLSVMEKVFVNCGPLVCMASFIISLCSFITLDRD